MRRFFGSLAFRTVLVLIVGGFTIAVAGTELRRAFGYPEGQYGFRSDGQVITYVAPGTPAARSGLRVGERINWANNPLALRRDVAQDYSPAPRDRLNVMILGVHSRSVVLVAVPEDQSAYPYLVIRNSVEILCVIIGGLLLVLRPSIATWALFGFSLGAVNFANSVTLDLTNYAPWLIAEQVICGAGIAYLGLIVFATMVGKSRPQRFDVLAMALGALLSIAYSFVYGMGPTAFADWSYAQWKGPSLALFLTAAILVTALIVRTYLEAQIRLRAALLWILLAVVVSRMLLFIDMLTFPEVLPYPIHALLATSPALIFAACAYVLFSNRIVDVNFVASRTLVYAILTSFVVGVLALVDWFVSKQLIQVRVGFLLEIAAALALGVTIQRVHKLSDGFVDRYVFRAVHEAELRLKRLGAALVHAPSEAVIDRVIAEDAADVLGLASAAVFHARSDAFVRTASSHWPAGALASIDSGHRLVLYLASEERAIVPDDVFANGDLLPEGTARPALAIPFIMRHRLAGFVLFGSHISGAQPDSKDVELLLEFVTRAAAAFDHIAMEQRTEENRALRTEVELLRSMVGATVR